MNIATAFMASRIELTPSGFKIEGAFPTFWSVPELPYTFELPIGFVANLDDDEGVGDSFAVTVEVHRTGHGGPIASQGVHFWLAPGQTYVEGAPLYIHEAVGLDVTFTDAGAHAVLIRHKGETLAIVPFGVRVLD
ncbi:MAG: hypothetical protein ACLQBX_05220 [Candidatus Limnocylindrales bacterium]